jgi:hypothetical protein
VDLYEVCVKVSLTVLSVWEPDVKKGFRGNKKQPSRNPYWNPALEGPYCPVCLEELSSFLLGWALFTYSSIACSNTTIYQFESNLPQTKSFLQVRPASF